MQLDLTQTTVVEIVGEGASLGAGAEERTDLGQARP